MNHLLVFAKSTTPILERAERLWIGKGLGKDGERYLKPAVKKKRGEASFLWCQLRLPRAAAHAAPENAPRAPAAVFLRALRLIEWTGAWHVLVPVCLHTLRWSHGLEIEVLSELPRLEPHFACQGRVLSLVQGCIFACRESRTLALNEATTQVLEYYASREGVPYLFKGVSPILFRALDAPLEADQQEPETRSAAMKVTARNSKMKGFAQILGGSAPTWQSRTWGRAIDQLEPTLISCVIGLEHFALLASPAPHCIFPLPRTSHLAPLFGTQAVFLNWLAAVGLQPFLGHDLRTKLLGWLPLTPGCALPLEAASLLARLLPLPLTDDTMIANVPPPPPMAVWRRVRALLEGNALPIIPAAPAAPQTQTRTPKQHQHQHQHHTLTGASLSPADFLVKMKSIFSGGGSGCGAGGTGAGGDSAARSLAVLSSFFAKIKGSRTTSVPAANSSPASTAALTPRLSPALAGSPGQLDSGGMKGSGAETDPAALGASLVDVLLQRLFVLAWAESLCSPAIHPPTSITSTSSRSSNLSAGACRLCPVGARVVGRVLRLMATYRPLRGSDIGGLVSQALRERWLPALARLAALPQDMADDESPSRLGCCGDVGRWVYGVC
ncbi:hypothetical protein PAPYR_8979 [Paratrimastix pyriformis]|uniref:Uncharacterized protein n=1 Tax=Paratrimastix pyriformis TaxID=342808 RepID=A0ABQ8UE64_9EUKA|nr:hypothetical protein PAPYR_8979 [Paratrimastix pyriformis]